MHTTVNKHKWTDENDDDADKTKAKKQNQQKLRW